MSAQTPPPTPADGAAGAAKTWASGRTLSEAQRERKRQKDRASKSKRRKDDQRLVDSLKAKVEELTAQVIALEQQQQQQSDQPPAAGPSAATTTADPFANVAYHPSVSVPTAQTAYHPEHATQRVTTGFVQELPDNVDSAGSADHTAPAPVLPLPHETAVATQTRAGILQPGEPPLVQDLFNHLLGMALVADRSMICVDEALSQDAIIRGILNGWDTVLAALYVCPLWEILSRFDMLIFAFTSVLTRFSTLKTIRHFLLYLSGTIHEKDLPAWHRPRPTQVRFPHDLAVDVLPWPGLRERAVLDPTVTKSNRFWREIIGLFELHWPYQPEEAFQVDPMTNLFTFSGLYENHVREIRMWRMKTDFFKSFPAVFDDIAMYAQIYPQPNITAMRAIEPAPAPSNPLDEDERQAQSKSRQVIHQPAWQGVTSYRAPFPGTG